MVGVTLRKCVVESSFFFLPCTLLCDSPLLLSGSECDMALSSSVPACGSAHHRPFKVRDGSTRNLTFTLMSV